MSTLHGIEPGDLLFTRSKTGLGGRLIRTGAALLDRPNLDNHVAIYHHEDDNGTPWAIEGRPGGVGWRDARDYVRSPWTLNNVLQPKNAKQRDAVCAAALSLLGTPYDWQAIAEDALKAFGIPLELAWKPGAGAVQGHVVCSSLAQYAYRKAGLAHPAGDRLTSPADWEAFVIEHRWNVSL